MNPQNTWLVRMLRWPRVNPYSSTHHTTGKTRSSGVGNRGKGIVVQDEGVEMVCDSVDQGSVDESLRMTLSHSFPISGNAGQRLIETKGT